MTLFTVFKRGVTTFRTPRRVVPSGFQEVLDEGTVKLTRRVDHTILYYWPHPSGTVVLEQYGYGWRASGGLAPSEVPRRIRKWVAARRKIIATKQNEPGYSRHPFDESESSLVSHPRKASEPMSPSHPLSQSEPNTSNHPSEASAPKHRSTPSNL